MSRYEIAFSGELAPGATLEQVEANLTRLFQADAQRIALLFSGRRVVIKQDLDYDSVEKYRQAMARAGAVAEVRPMPVEVEEIELAPPLGIGRARHIDDGLGRYVEYAKTTLPRGASLAGLKVVVDCAHGAAYKAAPEVLWELGAEVVPLGVAPDGFNINREVGSTHPRTAAETVVAHGAHVGLCLDGDADRVVMIDETGTVADGDQFMALLARRWAAEGRLRHNTLVATVMSNLGLEQCLAREGLRLERTAVGDRYVVERMRAGGFNLGGEQSGHIVMTDHATTGDGLIAGLQFLLAMVEEGQPASALARQFEPVPQMLRNVRFQPGQTPMEAASVQAAMRSAASRLEGQGRLLIRKSGTEPLVRVMAECEDPALLQEIVEGLVAEIEAVLKAPA